MAKLIACKTCGAQIAKTAKICPACGAKNKSRHPVFSGIGLGLLIIFIILIVGIVISSMNDDPTKVSPATASGQPKPSAAAVTEPPVYSIGDTLEMKDVQVTLLAVRNNTGKNYYTPDDGEVFIVFEVEIANNSKSEVAVSSLLSFKAYADDYTLEYSLSGIFADGGQQLDGSIDPEKKMRGIVSFAALEDWQAAEFRFTPNVWTGKDFIFTVSRDQVK